MRREFLIERQGRTFVLYAGLLDEAHGRLVGIATELLQAPTEANGQTTICRATVTIRGADGAELRFSGIGDANPGNVGRQIVPHAIRMAETRAKARALRDAVNVGIVCLDELADDDVDQVAAAATAAAAREPVPIAAAPSVRAAAAAQLEPAAAAPADAAEPGPLPSTAGDLAGLDALGKARLWSALKRRALGCGLRPAADPPATAIERAILALAKQIDGRERQAAMGMAR